MIVKQQRHVRDALDIPFNNDNYFKNRVGFWAVVIEVDDCSNTCTIRSDTGFEYTGIPVMSREWVNDRNDFVPSERYLPPVNSVVFVLTPTYSISGAFILCSGYTRGDTNLQKLWASNNEAGKKSTIKETVSQGGWDQTEDYSNGNRKQVSQDKKISFEINPAENSDKSEKKQIQLIAWNNIINISEDGISITDCNNNIVNSTNGGISIKDKNNNKVEISYSDSSNSILIQDKNSQKIEMASTSSGNSILIQDKNKNKIKMSSTGIDINGYLTINAGAS